MDAAHSHAQPDPAADPHTISHSDPDNADTPTIRDAHSLGETDAIVNADTECDTDADTICDSDTILQLCSGKLQF